MTLEQLRIFVAVAEREHVTRASADLHLTQSATSAAIAALEHRYDVKLFDRVGRRIELTAAGRLFLGEARAVLARARSAEDLLTDISGLQRGGLSLAASQTVANYWLPARLHLFRSAYPGLTVTLRIGNSRQVAAWVQDGSVDLGLIEGDLVEPALDIAPVAEDELVLVVGARHPWSGRRAIQPKDLADSFWVLREPGSGTRAMFENWLTRIGVVPGLLPISLELPSNEAVRSAVEAGAGATVISRVVVAEMLRSGSLVALDLPLPTRHFYAVRHRDRHVTRAQQAFEAQINERPSAKSDLT